MNPTTNYNAQMQSSTLEQTDKLLTAGGMQRINNFENLESSEVFFARTSGQFQNLTGRSLVLDRSIHEPERDDDNMAASTQSHNPLEESSAHPHSLTNSELNGHFGALEQQNEVVKNNQIKTNKRKIVLYVALLVVAVASAALTSFMTVGFALTGNLPFAALTGAAALGSLATIGICIAKIAHLSRENKRLQGLI
ncbi:MAG: hypothetical protein BGO10_04915 [Chlamydia sp. 32-24]|mgnify:FL=1|nr:MAG: hypothetical protein BGO10_04915 [Chlamydia sp. 32-24]